MWRAHCAPGSLVVEHVRRLPVDYAVGEQEDAVLVCIKGPEPAVSDARHGAEYDARRNKSSARVDSETASSCRDVAILNVGWI